MLGCSNTDLLVSGTTTTISSIYPKRDIPKKEDVVNKDMVVNDRTIVLTGRDLYVNSKFVRSRIPASRFSSITRGRDIENPIDFPNEEMIDMIVQELYNRATPDEIQFFEDNIEEIEFKFDIVVQADTTCDDALQTIKEQREDNIAEDELFSNFGVAEVAISEEGTRNSEARELNLMRYRKVNRHNRYRSPDEIIIKAYRLAIYFLKTGNTEEFKNICKMFGVKPDMDKIEKTLTEGIKRRAVFKDSSFKNTINGILDWIKQYGKNGDIISRCLDSSCFYGRYDHSGFFNKVIYRKYNNKRECRCVLASYSSTKTKWKLSPGEAWRNPQRLDYAAYEALGNFTDSSHVAINRPLNKDLGEIALLKAIRHFYHNSGDNSKDLNATSPNKGAGDYDKWCYGQYYDTYWNQQRWYDHVSEYCKTTNASQMAGNQVNYCSFIPYYGYRWSSTDINWDQDNSNQGNMIVPEDIVNSCSDKNILVWGWVRKSGACGDYTAYEQFWKNVYKRTTNMIYFANTFAYYSNSPGWAQGKSLPVIHITSKKKEELKLDIKIGKEIIFNNKIYKVTDWADKTKNYYLLREKDDSSNIFILGIKGDL